MRFILFIFLLFTSFSAVGQTAVEGYQAYNAGQYKKAKAIILPLAEQGDPIAMNAIGNWHADGILREKSRRKACDWYEKAALTGYLPAQNNFAYCFYGSGGRKTSIKKHLDWLTRAAEKSYLNAQLSLMFWYMSTNKEMAKKWGEAAVTQGSTIAKVTLWMSNLDKNIPPTQLKEIACVFYNNMLLERDWSTCDN